MRRRRAHRIRGHGRRQTLQRPTWHAKASSKPRSGRAAGRERDTKNPLEPLLLKFAKEFSDNQDLSERLATMYKVPLALRSGAPTTMGTGWGPSAATLRWPSRALSVVQVGTWMRLGDSSQLPSVHCLLASTVCVDM